jgi:L-2-hydroxyglutarate oxidase LhgO
MLGFLVQSTLETVDTIIIGAGVIGLACARALAQLGQEVLILEAESTIGSGISSRNSEVIHAGIYYPVGSNKAKLCLKGKELLYEFCQSHGVAHKRLGKLIVAVNDSEIAELAKIKAKAIANGVLDLAELDQQQLRQLEPELNAVAGLFSPSTGIIDSHQYMLSLLGDAEQHSAMLILNSMVTSGYLDVDGIVLRIQQNSANNNAVNNNDDLYIKAKRVVNAAGLQANQILSTIEGFPTAHAPKLYYCKGNYFTLNTPSPFRHLIYPVPNNAGLGVHLTLDLMNRAKFGPDTEWIDAPNFDVNLARLAEFYQVIRAYWPNLMDDSLSPGYTGIRPKLVSNSSSLPADFCIQTEAEHGVAGLVNLLGIESPGLTASLAIAAQVADVLKL